MNKYRKLINNSAIFALGNLGSKLILIFLVPLYTYYLTASEYGRVDIVTTTISMLLPIISLSIYEAVLRYVMDNEYDNESVFTNSLVVTFIGILFGVLIYPFLRYLNILTELLPYMYIILFLQAIQMLLTQFIRAIGKIMIYSINGIMMTVITAVLNIYFLVQLKMGIPGYFISIIVANIISILYLLIRTNIAKYIDLTKINKQLVVKMLTYSIPLIPNAFIWWTMNASNRYFILFYIGASANGLFAVANKIPTLLSLLNTVFFQAWQLSAIEEYGDTEKSKFYSNTFNYLSMTLFIGTSIILVFLKFIVSMLVSNEFYTVWEYVPFLLAGIIFSSFSGFLGTNYIAAKETKGVFKTSVLGGGVNIILNIILIPILGINGAGLSTLISFLIIWLIRVYDTRKYIKVDINKKSLIINCLLISFQTSILYITLIPIYEFIVEFILMIFVLIVNKNLLKITGQLLFSKMKVKLNKR
nr:polysaccharide biosynthesis C-terminal domain-containing protein [Paenibacillus camerounensis]